jgi:hypothetical protein
MAQSDHGINRGGAAGWDVARGQSYDNEHQCYGGESEGVGRADAVEQAGHQARKAECGAQANRGADKREF